MPRPMRQPLAGSACRDGGSKAALRIQAAAVGVVRPRAAGQRQSLRLQSAWGMPIIGLRRAPPPLAGQPRASTRSRPCRPATVRDSSEVAA